MGVLDTIATAGALVTAAPIALLGVSFLLDGRLSGLAFLGLAIALIAVQRHLTTPGDVPETLAERAIEGLATDPEDDEKPER